MSAILLREVGLFFPKEEAGTGLKIAPVSGAFANKDFAFATKILPLVVILRPFYSLAYK